MPSACIHRTTLPAFGPVGVLEVGEGAQQRRASAGAPPRLGGRRRPAARPAGRPRRRGRCRRRCRRPATSTRSRGRGRRHRPAPSHRPAGRSRRSRGPGRSGSWRCRSSYASHVAARGTSSRSHRRWARLVSGAGAGGGGAGAGPRSGGGRGAAPDGEDAGAGEGGRAGEEGTTGESWRAPLRSGSGVSDGVGCRDGRTVGATSDQRSPGRRSRRRGRVGLAVVGEPAVAQPDQTLDEGDVGDQSVPSSWDVGSIHGRVSSASSSCGRSGWMSSWPAV